MPDTGGRALLEAELRTLTRDLDAELGELDLSTAVVRRLQTQSAPTRLRRPSPRRRVAVVLVAAIAATAVAALPAARAAVNRIFEIGAIEVREEPPPTLVPSGSAELSLGAPTALTDVRARVPVVVPTAEDLGSPDEVWFDDGAGGAVSLVYRAGPGLPASEHTGIGLLIQEFTGDGREAARKYLATDSRARAVTVDGEEGVFLSGGAHYFFYTDATGADVLAEGRLVGNALIFTRGDLTIRLEGDLPLDRMVEIASSLR
ncbi:MAG: hypothetical protein ACT4PI_18865 [Actinomycetota bacterium]